MKKILGIIPMMVICFGLLSCGKEAPISTNDVDAQNTSEDIIQEQIGIFPDITTEELLTQEQLQSYSSDAQLLQSVIDNVNFKSFSMESLDGEAVTQDIFLDSKMTMVILWSPYSGSSVYELSDLQYVENKIGDKSFFKVVGIFEDAYDLAGNKKEDVITEAKRITEDALVTYANLILPAGFEVETDALPVCLIVNNVGDVIYAWNDACDLDELMKIIKSVAVAQ